VADDFRKLTKDDLDQITGEPLPERAVMSLLNANVAIPVNAALALNLASDGSVAGAIAQQTGQITQTT
jgi:hypothetical protein